MISTRAYLAVGLGFPMAAITQMQKSTGETLAWPGMPVTPKNAGDVENVEDPEGADSAKSSS